MVLDDLRKDLEFDRVVSLQPGILGFWLGPWA